MRTIGITGHQRAPDVVWRLMRRELPPLLGRPPFRGVSSLAAGADQEFADTVVRLGGELFVVIPSENYQSSFDHELHRKRFETLLRCSYSSERLDYRNPCEDAFLAAGQRVVDLCDLLVAVWDGLPSQGKGGTADVVAYARQQGKRVEVIWPAGIKR